MSDFEGYENTIGQVGRLWFDKCGIVAELITTEQAAIELGYTERHVRRLCEEGKLIAIKVKRLWLVELPSLDFVRERLDETPF